MGSEGASQLYFDWDRSNSGHLARHRITPEEAEQVIRNDPFEIEEEFRGGERRQQFLGETNAKRILIVIARVSDESIRVITAWPAKRRLRAFWLTLAKGTRHGKENE